MIIAVLHPAWHWLGQTRSYSREHTATLDHSHTLSHTHMHTPTDTHTKTLTTLPSQSARRAGHFRYFLVFSLIKNDFLHFL